jgi:hypothetical protein
MSMAACVTVRPRFDQVTNHLLALGRPCKPSGDAQTQARRA